jgi:hypothetical protein
VKEVWGLDGHGLPVKPEKGEKNDHIRQAAAELLHENQFMLSEPDENVRV